MRQSGLVGTVKCYIVLYCAQLVPLVVVILFTNLLLLVSGKPLSVSWGLVDLAVSVAFLVAPVVPALVMWHVRARMRWEPARKAVLLVGVAWAAYIAVPLALRLVGAQVAGGGVDASSALFEFELLFLWATLTIAISAGFFIARDKWGPRVQPQDQLQAQNSPPTSG